MDFEYQNFGLGSDLGKMRIIGILAVLVLIATGILCAMLLSGSEASIIADSSDEALFITKNIEDFNVKFGYKQDPQIMVFERNNTGIGIKIPFENIVWEKTKDSIEASSGGYVFRYSIIKDGQGNSVGIKEEIILSKIPKQTNFEFPINLKNLRPQRIKDIWRFFDENNTEQFYIPKPFMIDAEGERSEQVEIEIVDNKITVIPDKDWLNDPKRVYPVIVDPSFMITILNIHSHPQAGDYWTVSFETIGVADLKIIPADQQTIDDLNFVSLTCNGEEKSPQITENDIIFFPDWSCDGTGEIVHIVNVAAPHILKFQFSDQIAFAYNDPDDWQHPDSTNDSDGDAWNDGDNAKDNDTGTSAVLAMNKAGSFLELILVSAINCDKIRIYAADYQSYHSTWHDPDIDIDLWYDDDWQNLFSGVITKDTWIEKEIGSTKSVSKARVTFNTIHDGGYFYEFEFNKVAGAEPEPNINTLQNIKFDNLKIE